MPFVLNVLRSGEPLHLSPVFSCHPFMRHAPQYALSGDAERARVFTLSHALHLLSPLILVCGLSHARTLSVPHNGRNRLAPDLKRNLSVALQLAKLVLLKSLGNTRRRVHFPRRTPETPVAHYLERHVVCLRWLACWKN